MATPNYGYEKRQRELAKKKKKEDKLRSKTDRKDSPSDALADTSNAGSPAMPVDSATLPDTAAQ